jgi:DNA-directed RNA polymerase specialized sigma24 family protein
MGASHVDLHRREREQDAQYPLDQPLGVRKVLEDWTRLNNAGDFDSRNVVLDAQQAIGDANLTAKQLSAIRLVLVEGITQEEAADELGLAGKPGVNNLLQRAINRIAERQGWADEETYAEWAVAWYGERIGEGAIE